MAQDAAQNAGTYAERYRAVVAALCAGFSTETVNLVMAHGFVRGGVLGGGERDAQSIEDYWVDASVFPPSAQYVALGHLHRTQQLPGGAPIWYCGSPIQVDFGEEGDRSTSCRRRRARASRPRSAERPLSARRRLRTLEGTMAELGPRRRGGGRSAPGDRHRAARSGLADDVRDLLPNAIDIRLQGARRQAAPSSTRQRPQPPRAVLGLSWPSGAWRTSALAHSSTRCSTKSSEGEQAMRLVTWTSWASGRSATPAHFDFSDAGFFALVGPTGSGKSTASTPCASPSTDRCPATRTSGRWVRPSPSVLSRPRCSLLSKSKDAAMWPPGWCAAPRRALRRLKPAWNCCTRTASRAPCSPRASGRWGRSSSRSSACPTTTSRNASPSRKGSSLPSCGPRAMIVASCCSGCSISTSTPGWATGPTPVPPSCR